MPSAELEQQREHVRADCGSEACRPSDDLELVRITRPVHIRTGIQQRADDLHTTATSGKVEGRGVVACVARVGISAMLEQQAYGADMLDREM